MLEPSPDGTADQPGNLRVALENAEIQARERAAEVALRDAKALAVQEEFARAAREAAARREAAWWERAQERLARHAELTDRLGSATPDPPRWSETSEPETPHAPVSTALTPAESVARRNDPRAVLCTRLRHCKSLDDAIREVRYALAAVAKPCDADEAQRLAERLNRAERLYRVHALDRLASLRAQLEREAAEIIRTDGLPEFAAALESGDWTRILEGPP